MTKKPKIKLVGTDGNVFALLGKVRPELVKLGYKESKINAIMSNSMSGDYRHAIREISKHFDIV